jgi:hypothetical protein
MEEMYQVSPRLKATSLFLISIGIVTFLFGLYSDPARIWANFLLSNYYFLSLSIGATFFLAIQYISQSGWSASFSRIPHAIGTFIPISGLLMLFLFFGMHSLYHWSHEDAIVHDELIQHKAGYLNVPFFFIRMVVFYGAWIFMTWLLRKISLQEDRVGGMEPFHRSEFYSKVFIFILAITFSFATFDLIMSIDVHWFSTLFAAMNFVGGFFHGVALIALIIILLNRQGHFKHLNRYHLLDISRNIFILSIIWTYLWFSQYLLIWFANIQEETIYYFVRTQGNWNIVFILNVVFNFAVPFVILLANKLSGNKTVILIVCCVLMAGLWIDLFLQIMPGAVGQFHLGYAEIGTFMGFSGIFIFVLTRSLNKMPLIPVNHPYLNESLHHEVH